MRFGASARAWAVGLCVVGSIGVFGGQSEEALAKPRKAVRSVTSSRASGSRNANVVLPAITGPSSAELFAPQNDAQARMVSQVYGKSVSFELKLAAGQSVDIEVGAPDGSVTASVCYAPDNIIAGLWGSSEAVCPGAGVIDHGAMRYRFEARGKAEVKVRLSRTGGDAGKTFTVRTRSATSRRGADMIAMFERMADRSYVRPAQNDGLPIKSTIDYRIGQRGSSGILRYRDEAGAQLETTLQIDDAGNLAWSTADRKGVVQPGPDGALNLFLDGDGAHAFVFSAGGSIAHAYYKRVVALNARAAEDTGSFTIASSQTLEPVSGAAASALIAAGPRTMAAARTQRLAQWGVLAKLAGHDVAFPNASGEEQIGRWQWREQGKSMTATFWTANQFETAAASSLTLSHDPKTGAVVGSYRNATGQTITRFKRLADGSVSEEWAGGSGVMKAQGADVAYFDGKSSKPRIYRILGNTDLAMYRDRTRAHAQQLAAAQAAAATQRSSNDGLIRGLIGAAVGGYAASVAGTNASDSVGFIMKGMAATTGNTALETTANSMLGTNAGGTSSATAMAGSASGAGKGVRHDGNLAENACASLKFTSDNYREMAMIPDGDVQLRTMCGQAYEYYFMYKRAFDQGGEAYAEPTWQAHVTAAANAANFRTNWAAD